MADITDEELRGYASDSGWTVGRFAAECLRLRAAKAADKERVRQVVKEACMAVERTAVTAVHIEKLDAIIDRAAEQLSATVDIDRAFLRRVLSRTKHGPGGRGGNGSCDTDCVKCEAERRLDHSKPHHAGRQAIPVINPTDTPELREAISKIKAAGGYATIIGESAIPGIHGFTQGASTSDAMVPGYTAGAGWQSRVHAAADKIDRGANVAGDERMISKVMATTGIDRAGAEQAIVDGRKLASELIAKCDAAVFLDDSPGVLASRAANTLPVIPIRTPVELVLAKLEAAAKAATAGKWDSPKEGPGSRHHAVVSDAGPLWDEGYGGQLIGESLSPANGAYIVATQPAAILALIATVREMIHLVKDWADRRQSEMNQIGWTDDGDSQAALERALFVEVP